MQRSSVPGSMRSVSKTFSCVATMFAALGLAACGGGGGGSDNPPANPPPPPPPSAPANTAPTVSAGTDQTIKLPTNAVDLQGSATDAEGGSLTYSWAASPAAGVTFANATAAATNVTFTDAGTYTLTLSASDGSATGTDAVQVTVSPADAPPPPPPPPAALVWPAADPNDPVADPNHGWVAGAPADVGMDPTLLDSAEAYAKTGGGAGMITRHGKLVRKWSDSLGDADPVNDITIDSKTPVKSTTKSIGGIALALALDDGLLTLDDLATAHLSTVGNPPVTNPQDQLNQIRIFHLATHTAGFEKDGVAPDLLYGPPGTTFFYSDGGLNWLADVLTTKHGKDLYALLNDRVWRPIGITTDDLVWSQRATVNGLQFRRLASDISTNANAMARIGLLYLRNGMWNGTQILKESSVKLAGTPVPQIAQIPVHNETEFPNATKKYGLLWWTNANKELPDVPADAYWAWGLGDSLIVVIPSLDLVISRVGTNADGNGPHWRYEGAPLASRPDWDGNYEILRPFLTPIVQSVTNPAL
jgi:CubicO group peptidase (beta-lactamase class C family)